MDTINTNFFSSFSLHVHGIAGLASGIPSLLEWRPECSITNFVLASLQGMAPPLCVCIWGSVALYFSSPFAQRSPAAESGRRAGQHGISKVSGNQCPRTWKVGYNGPWKGRKQLARFFSATWKKQCVYGSGQARFISNKHSLNIYYVPEPMLDVFNISID